MTVFAGIAGSHIRSVNSNGMVAIKEQEVTQNDIERVIDAAKAIAIPADDLSAANAMTWKMEGAGNALQPGS